MEFEIDTMYESRKLAIIRGKGEFNAFYCPWFNEEVERVVEGSGIIAIGYDFEHVDRITTTPIRAVLQKRAYLDYWDVKDYLLAPVNPAVTEAVTTLSLESKFRAKPIETVLQEVDEMNRLALAAQRYEPGRLPHLT